MTRTFAAVAVVVLSLGILLVAWLIPGATPSDPAQLIQAWCAPAAEGLIRPSTCPASTQASPPAPGIPVVGPAVAPKPSIAQLKARELDLRIGFSTASAIVRVAAIIVVLGSFGIVAKGWLIRRTDAATGKVDGVAIENVEGSIGRLPDADVGKVDGVALVLLSTGLLAGAIGGCMATYGDGLTTLLLNNPIKMNEPQISVDATSALAQASIYNLVMGFAAAGTLLALFAQIARSSDGSIERLQALQFALLMGAALFAASSFANGQAGAWAKGVLDPIAMKDAMSAIDRLVEYWAVLGSLFLVAAAGTAYLAIILSEPVAKDIDSHPLALRTSDNKELKFFGLLVNFLLALTPIWTSLHFVSWPLF